MESQGRVFFVAHLLPGGLVTPQAKLAALGTRIEQSG